MTQGKLQEKIREIAKEDEWHFRTPCNSILEIVEDARRTFPLREEFMKLVLENAKEFPPTQDSLKEEQIKIWKWFVEQFGR